MNPVSTARSAARAAAIVGVTTSFSGALTAARLRAGEEGRERVTMEWMNRFGRAWLRVFGVRLLVEGPGTVAGAPYPGCSDNDKGRLFLLNHRSGLDIAVVLATIEARLLSRGDLAHWPLIGYVARQVGTLFVDRSSSRSGAGALKTMARSLKDGRAIALFPEGTAYRGDEVRPLKVGAFKAAQIAQAEIVPIALAYSNDEACYGDESFGAHMTRVMGLPRLRVAVEFGNPISPPHGRDVRALAETTRMQMQQLVQNARQRL